MAHHASTDHQWMAYALTLASRQLGRTSPNPAVGCVIVKDNDIIGFGATADGGRPHAETQALQMAGANIAGATLYVTLEPCAHTGQTSPCTAAIIAAAPARVVIACMDADPRVSQRGIAALQQAGITVELGVMAEQAAQLNEGFFRRITQERPLITSKIACTADGRISDSKGESQWITSEVSRQFGHGLRAQHDAMLTGIGTVLADDPKLTCRLPGITQQNRPRIVVDTHLRTPVNARLFDDISAAPLILMTSAYAADSANATALKQAGTIIETIAMDDNGRLDLTAAMTKLATDYGITRLMVEAGATLNSALLNAQLIDELYWIDAPFFLGSGGAPALQSLGEISLGDIEKPRLMERFTLGEDRITRYRLSPCLPALLPILAR